MDQPKLRALLNQYVAGTIAAQDRIVLSEMLRSPAHQEELEQLLDEGFNNDMIAGLSDPERADLLFNRILPATRPVRNLRWLPYAAAVLILIAAGIFMWPRPQPANDAQPGFSKATLTLADGSVVPLDSAGDLQLKQGNTAIRQQNGQISYLSGDASLGTTYNTLSIPRGGQFNIVLPDGSKVWLNSASSLRYPVAFNGTERKVELQGQAYFEIAQNAGKPFKVVTPDGMEVLVLGTHFDIMAYADEDGNRTTLLEGAVRVTKGAGNKTLQPGQQVLVKDDHLTVEVVDVNQVTAWKAGFFEFSSIKLPALMRQLERWYDVNVVYQGKYPDVLFSGRISRNMPLSQFLEMLDMSGIRFRIEGKQLIVMSTQQ